MTLLPPPTWHTHAACRGVADPGQQLVMLTLADLVALLTGARPDEGNT